jgi:hypothetical protein
MAAAAAASAAQGELPFAEQGLVPLSMGAQVELVPPAGSEALAVAQQVELRAQPAGPKLAEAPLLVALLH